MAPRKRGRQPRFSAPSVSRPASSAFGVTSTDIQLDRFRRESTGAIAFIPGNVKPLLDGDYVEDEASAPRHTSD